MKSFRLAPAATPSSVAGHICSICAWMITGALFTVAFFAPLSALVFYTTKPMFDDRWFWIFVSISAATFALPALLRAIWRIPPDRIRTASGYGLFASFVTACIVAKCVAWTHNLYRCLPKIGEFQLIPPLFTLLPLSAGITIFALCFWWRRVPADAIT